MVERPETEQDSDMHRDITEFLRSNPSTEQSLPYGSFLVGKMRGSRHTRPTMPLDALLLSDQEFLKRRYVTYIRSDIPTRTIANEIRELTSTVESLMRELVSNREAIDRLYEEFYERPIVKETMLFDIDDQLELVQPIPVIIEETEDEVIASFPEIEVFGVADTESEALSNLKKNIVDLYYDLSQTTQDELGELPLSWLRVLKRILRRNGDA